MKFLSTKKSLLATAAAACLALTAMPASALTIELRNTGGVEVGTQAYDGFRAAARFWELALTNDVNVKLNVGYAALGAGILGSTGSTTNVAYAGDVIGALQGTGNSKLDGIAKGYLNQGTRDSTFIGGKAVDALISAPRADGTGVALPLTKSMDNDASGNNSALSANTSLLKALGIAPVYTGANAAIQADGNVTFSSNFAFDFDPTNGIDSDKFDFLGVAIHEIGHALGFRSGVDVYDGNTGFTGNLGNFAIMSVWDLFRYSTDSAAQGVRDWTIGGNPYFSINGGATVYNSDAYFSTGRRFGDGQQASHWKDAPPAPSILGLLDPTAGRGQQLEVETLDIAAMDAMGWNVAYDVLWLKDRSFSTAIMGSLDTLRVPEPGAAALALLALGLAGVARRRAASKR